MELKLKQLQQKDEPKAIQFAIKGMHFDWYLKQPCLLNLYGRYFWYLELNRATQVIAAYRGEELEGVLLAAVKGETTKYRSFGKTLYVKLFDVLQRLFAKGVDVYNEANRDMYSQYRKSNTPDGEILFLAANPQHSRTGVGTLLLSELERRERGKQIYLYIDSACSYQFYEHRGFELFSEKNIVLKLGNRAVELRCLLYSKEIG